MNEVTDPAVTPPVDPNAPVVDPVTGEPVDPGTDDPVDPSAPDSDDDNNDGELYDGGDIPAA